MAKKPSCIHWFRKGLRLHDNPALLSALEPDKKSGQLLELRPVFILDPWFVKNAIVGVNRWRFLAQTLADLDDQLRKLGSRLFVVRGAPKEVMPDLFKKWNVKKLTFESDTEPYAVTRDSDIQKLAKEHDVDVLIKLSNTLYNPDLIVKANAGVTPITYQKFQSLAASLGPPPKPVATLTSENFPSACRFTEGDDDLKKTAYDPPSLKELGIKNESDLEPCLYPGGETEGLKRLDKFICESNGKWVRSFEKPNTSPNSLEPSTTVLSPYIKFGCVSCREMYWRLVAINDKGKHSNPPVSLVGQLFWREFFYTAGATIANFDKMKGNKVCRQIPWQDDKEKLAAWAEARTGYPFIDAIMTQLRKEGWIHHLARHAVACFLTRGDLWVSWERGKEVFEELLLDADWSLNAGNWMWLSASAFFHQYFRVYSPIAFGKKTDPTGSYIRKHLPLLAKFPDKYIYEPWNAPMSVQQAAGCIIGKDYPKPIVAHDKVHKENIGKMKAAYDAAKSADPGKKSASPKKRPAPSDGKSQSKITKFMKK